ncbi:MAG TPA: inositol monophosphatase [Opitutaceae bacterium]|jgi:myo-inositol-1(or 4)-monophosphatase|nr:inositol monophosphatase [Opitutaceae bacterium]
MSSSELVSRIEAAKRAVLSQTELFHREFGRAKSNWKSDGTRVTPVDIAISENIFRELGAQFPDDQFFSEELADAGAPIAVTARFAWVLDPIDGTNNYALGIPYCAIALALCENGTPVYGVIYDLARRSLIHGGPGFGVHDGERLIPRLKNEPPHKESLVGLHSPTDKTLVPLADNVLSQFKIRGLGSAALHLAYVATGLFEGTVDFNVKIWDLAAAIPLCLEAGGEVHFLNGGQLPMRQFDLKMKPIMYFAGSPVVCTILARLLKV